MTSLAARIAATRFGLSLWRTAKRLGLRDHLKRLGDKVDWLSNRFMGIRRENRAHDAAQREALETFLKRLQSGPKQ